MTSPDVLADFDGQLIVVANPASTLLKKTAGSLNDLIIRYRNRVQMFWTEEDKKITQAELAAKLQSGDIILAGGGDGTDHMVVETLVSYPDLEATVRKTPILSLYGGNANMGASELTPRIFGRAPSPKRVLETGRLVEIHPLETTLKHEGEASRTYIAAYFLGVGATGLAAKHLDDVRDHPLRKSRLTRWIPDGIAVTSALRAAPVFTARQGKIIQEVYEMSAVSGDRMGKFGRFAMQLTDPEFLAVAMSDKRLHRVAVDLGRFATRRLPSERVNFSEFTIDVEAATEQKTWLQIDGEPHELPGGSTIRVQRHPQTFRAITTNPRLH